jgi:hypothetical protein
MGYYNGRFGDSVAQNNRDYGGLAAVVVESLREHNERVENAQEGDGFKTNVEVKIEKLLRNAAELWFKLEGNSTQKMDQIAKMLDEGMKKIISERGARGPAIANISAPAPIRMPPPKDVPSRPMRKLLPKLRPHPQRECNECAKIDIHSCGFGELVNALVDISLAASKSGVRIIRFDQDY